MGRMRLVKVGAMTERAWVFVPDPKNGHRSGIKIECNDCGKEEFFAPNSGGRFPPEAAANRFRREGWVVGKGPRRDFCPSCAAQREQKQGNTNVVEMPKPKPAQAAAPRFRGREDRRLIVAEIKGCWDEEKARYMDGWHDERVAQSLGAHVPKAWVTEVREDYFGESGSNDQFDELLRRCEAVSERVEQTNKLALNVMDQVSALQKTLSDMNLLAKEVRRAIAK